MSEKEEAEGKEETKAGASEEGLNPPPSGFAKNKKLILIAVGALLLLVGGGAAGFVASGMMGGGHGEEPAAEEAEAADAHGGGHAAPAPEKKAASGHGKTEGGAESVPGAPVFMSLGDILVNLSGDGKRPNFLKIKVSLDLADEKDKATIEGMKPRIIDNFQVYLRELRVEDLRGSAGLQRLREELLLRVTEIAAPVRVREVLFQEMLVQ